MGASSAKTIAFDRSVAAAFDAVGRALDVLGATGTEADRAKGIIVAAMGDRWLSRGEVITVRIEPLPPGGCAVHLLSESATDLDWGKNANNLANLERSLLGELGPARPGPSGLAPSPPAATRPSFIDVSPVPSADPDPSPEREIPEAPEISAAGGSLSIAVDAELSRTQLLLAALESRRAASEAAAPEPASAADAATDDRRGAAPFANRRRAGDQPHRAYRRIDLGPAEPDGEQVPQDSRFVCAIDGEPGPVEPCSRCGRRVCAKHRRRSLQTVVFIDPVYVCEVCFREEVAEQRATREWQELARSQPVIQRIDQAWQRGAGGKGISYLAALGTGITVLLAALLLGAMTRSFAGLLFMLMMAGIALYIWSSWLGWWSEEALQRAPRGRLQLVWLLAVPGLFVAGGLVTIVAALARLPHSGTGRAARFDAMLDGARRSLLSAAEDGFNRVLGDE
jgi:hypothetical protein